MTGIRADANNIIASGHIMRCISIATQLQLLGEEIVFIVSQKEAESLVVANGFPCVCLNNSYDKKDEECDKLGKIIRKLGLDALIIDSYQVTKKYLSYLKDLVKIIYIDDLDRFKYPVDMLINYGFGIKDEDYKHREYKDIKMLFGEEYMPLRPQFMDIKRRIYKKPRAVYITTGGTDENDMILKLLNRMQKGSMAHLDKYIVTGKFYKSFDMLENMAKKDNKIKPYRNIANVATLMKKCDLAISAGGTTLSELCACGTPSISFAIADNQLKSVKAFDEAGIIYYAGNVREGIDAVLDNICNRAEYFLNDYEARKNISINARKKVDGNGAKRIALAIKQHIL